MEGGSLSLSPMPGGGDDGQMDLSRYGGVKPEFDAMERDDDKAIENLNAQLLGIQTGGQNESLERAKHDGIASVVSNPPQLSPSMQIGGSNQNTHQGGLNFSFNQQDLVQRPQLSMPSVSSPIQNIQSQQLMLGGGGVQSAGGEPRKQVSFNNDIKVVELDTKISEGFLYSGSKNLDPFGQ
jgi:hypothetical protein